MSTSSVDMQLLTFDNLVINYLIKTDSLVEEQLTLL